MPDAYNVSMGQAVSVSDLGGNSLVTGITSVNGNFDPARALVSCSAVAMVNTRTGAAGLFHFPSGDINDSGDAEVRRSQQTLIDLARDVRPNKVFFGHGPGLQTGFALGHLNANLPTENADLRRFVQRLAPEGRMSEEFHKATAGAFLIGRDGEGFEVDLQPDDTDMGRVVDLSEVRAGSYPGYRVYGRTVSDQAAEDRRTGHQYDELRRGRSNTPAPRDQSGPSGAGAGAPRDQFDVDDSIPNVPQRHKRRWLKKAIRRMTCRGG